jgi:hypothetical protein
MKRKFTLVKTQSVQRLAIVFALLVMSGLTVHLARSYTVAASEAAPCTITPITTNVNIREGPGTNYSVISVLPLGQSGLVVAQRLGTDRETWWQLDTGGWVSSTVVTTRGDCHLVPDLDLVPTRESLTFYVSRNGNNMDGLSWSAAWNELSAIDWGMIQAGDTILIDGGETEMVYTTPLVVGKSGTPDRPIHIQLADEQGRDGQAVIFGGRSTPLPYCDQQDYRPETGKIHDHGILIRDHAWIVIDGTRWGGIAIHGHQDNGIRLENPVSNITVRNMEIYDNGVIKHTETGWRSDSPGVRLVGSNITLERMNIRDNGQDAIQSPGIEGNFVVRDSWLHNTRPHPTVDESFNYCMHTDGLQIYDGGTQSGIVMERTVIGPGFTNGILLGSTGAGSRYAVVHDVTLRDVLFTKAADNNIVAYPNTPATNWLLERVTADCPNTKYYCLYLEGSNHTIRDSIVVGGWIAVPNPTETGNNCQWDTEGPQLGEDAAPLFRDVQPDDVFSIDDYSQLAESPCLGSGSRITSPHQLLNETGEQIAGRE